MRKVLKVSMLTVAGLILLLVAAVLVVPMFISAQQYKPQIEKRIADATGRPVKIEGIRVSVFPWAGLRLSNLQVGNPPGFEGTDFLDIKSFEIRIELLSLLERNIRVKRFVVEKPVVVLVRNAEGQGNWRNPDRGGAAGFPPPKAGEKEQGSKEEAAGGSLIKDLKIEELAVTDGLVKWIKTGGESREYSGVNLHLKDVSRDNPIGFEMALSVVDKPVSLKGTVGPLGENPATGSFPIDLTLKALDQLDVKLKGSLVRLADTRQLDVDFEVLPFSLRGMHDKFSQQTFPLITADLRTLEKIALKGHLKAGPQSLVITEGKLELDDSHLDFTATVHDFSKPDIKFDAAMDWIDLDRYLPPPAERRSRKQEGKRFAAAAVTAVDAMPASTRRAGSRNTFLRNGTMDGALRADKLKVRGAHLENLSMKLSGKNGLFRAAPLRFDLYQGTVASDITMDMRDNARRTSLNIQGSGVQAGPLLRDVAKKDSLEGTLEIDAEMSMTSDETGVVKQTINGKGRVVIKNGSFKGGNMGEMMQNVRGHFGFDKAGAQKNRTDFDELRFPFTILNGVLDSRGATLISPVARITAEGQANLVDETLDFRVEPKLASALKRPGVNTDRTPVAVLVTGTFSNPRIRPEFDGILKGKVGERLREAPFLKRLIPGEQNQQDQSAPPQRRGGSLLRSLPFGRQ